jgi:S-adenosylmethionine hydrolase
MQKALAIFDSFGNLEVAVNRANASNILGVKMGGDVQISLASSQKSS